MSPADPTHDRPEALTDDQLLQKARNAANGHKFSTRFDKPYEGSVLETQYDTRWRAEVALMENLAFWTGRDRSRMWRLFTESALYEERIDLYDQHPEHRRALIKKALDLNDSVYGPDDDTARATLT